MTTIMQSEIFFFISSIGFVVLFLILLAILIYILRAVRSLTRMIEAMEKNVNMIGDETRKFFEEMFDKIRDNVLFRFFFGGNRKREKKKKEE